jgi:hypothetical protein
MSPRYLSVVFRLADNADGRLVVAATDQIPGAEACAWSWSNLMDERDTARMAHGQMRTETALDVGATAVAGAPEPHIHEPADPAAPLLPLSEHEVTMAVETAWEAAEQEILDGEPPRYGEHVAILIQHACAEKWGVQLSDTGTKP